MKSYKGYLIQPHKQYPRMLYVATEGQGGKIPNVLTSLFTSYLVAMEAIDKYVEDKGTVKNGKTRSES